MTDEPNKTPDENTEETSTEGAPTPDAESTIETPPPASGSESIPPPPGTTPEDSATREFEPSVVEAGKTFAILSYALSFIGLPFFLVPVITRDNEYSLFHAKQNMLIWIAGAVSGVVSTLLTVICIGPFIGLAALLFLLAVNIMGLMQSINGQAKPLPLIGPYAVKWFKGLTVVTKG